MNEMPLGELRHYRPDMVPGSISGAAELSANELSI